MANLYTDSRLGDIVKVSSIVGGYYEMVVVEKKAPNEVWLVDKVGQGKHPWRDWQDKCNAFVDVLTKSVRDSITETRLLTGGEIGGSGFHGQKREDRLTFFDSAYYNPLSIFEAKGHTWWTNTTVVSNSSMAYATYELSMYGLPYSKSEKYEIHPLVILNGTQNIEGITLPPKKISVPTLYQYTYEYDGNSYEPTIDYNGNEAYITTSKSYSGKQSAVGTYTITFTLKDTSKYNWSNNPKGATAEATQTWEIKAPAFTPITTVPTPNKTLTYNGSEQTMTFDGYDEAKMTVSGNKATNAGTYTAKITPKTGYSWSDGTTGAKSVQWSIGKKSLEIPSVSPLSFVYNGLEQSPNITINSETAKYVKQGGTASAVNINSKGYTITFTINSTSNCEWSDGTTAAKSFTWYITHQKIDAKPSQNGTLIYNGKSQSPKWNNYDADKMAIGGVTSGTNAGTYKATFTPKPGYAWVDGSTGTIEVEWVINRLKLTPPKQKGVLFYNKSKQSPIWDTNYTITMTGETSGVDAGTYYVSFVCDSNRYFEPHDQDSDMKVTVGWTIKRCPTAVPPIIVDKEFEYDGTERRPTWEVEDESVEILVLRGDLVAINAGDYTITAYPAENYSWGNGSTSGVVYTWKVTRKPILKDPNIRDTTLEYNGEEQSPELVNYPQDFVSGTGLSAVNAGDYTAVFTIDGNHCWTNRTFAPIRIKWKIGRKKISKPYYNNKLVFNGSEQHPDWVGINFDTLEEAEDDEGNKILRGEFFEVSGDLNGIHAGEYTTTFTPTANYQWGDVDYEPYSVNWEIDKYHFKYPFQSENRSPYNPDMSEYLQYNGKAQSPTLWFGNIYNRNITTVELKKAFKVRKTPSAVNVGDYVVQLTPDADHCWEDGNSEPYDVPWKIIKYQLSRPSQNANGLSIPSPRGEQYYTGEIIYPEFDNYDPNILEISGQTSGVDLGDYVVYFDIKDKENYEWADGREGKMPVTWRIINPPKLIERPIQCNYLIYNGEYQSPIWDGYDPKAMILVGGNPRKKDVGKYNVQFSLKSGYAWTDETTENAVVPWYIYKKNIARPFVSGTDNEGFGGQYVEVDGKHYPVWVNYDPDVMTISGDTYTVDDLIHLTIFTLKRPDIYKWVYSYDWAESSSAPIEVRWRLDTPYAPDTGGVWVPGGGQQDDETIYPGGNPAIPNEIIGIPGVVDFPPSDLPSLITYDQYIDKLHPGDRFPIELNGVVGGVEFKHAWFFVYIIGFDHNSQIEGDKTIHFQFAKRAENGQEIAFTDKYYGQLGEGKGFCMNETDTANGGWKDSYMRTICRQLYYAMPKAWRNIIIPCPKYTDNAGDGNDSPDSVTMTKDKIFLLSEYECTGEIGYSNHAEEDYQKQYDYYKLNGFKGKSKYNNPNGNVESWLRSPSQSSDGAFCSVDYSASDLCGESKGNSASLSLGFAPCFAVGGTGSPGMGGDYDPDNPEPNKPILVVDGSGNRVPRVHIPQQINPPYEDGTVKSPQWDEYNDYAIVNLGGEWDGVLTGTYHVILKLNPGYIWEDGTTEVKIVPWRILTVGELIPSYSPIRVTIPTQINIPHYNRRYLTPEWDEWNEFAINIIGGTYEAVIADMYYLKVELRPGYVWEDSTTEKKELLWQILPLGASVPDNPDKPEIIEQSISKPYKPGDGDPEDDISNSSDEGYIACCCCGCDMGLFDMLNNAQCDNSEECDCTKEVEI